MITFKNLKRGDTAALLIPLAADYSAAPSALWTLKRSTADADSAAVTQKANGYGVAFTATSATVTLVHADTKPLDPAQLYHWDLQVQVGGVVTTVEQGTLRVDADVTREVVQTIPIYQTDPVNPATLAAEVVLRESADASVAAEAAADLSAEELVRLSGDASLDSALDAEIARAESADASLATAITGEASTRSSADVSLAAVVSTRASERVAADLSLSSAISTADISLASAITGEASTRSSADVSLAASIATKATTGAAASFSTITTTGAITCAGIIVSPSAAITANLTLNAPSSSQSAAVTYANAGVIRFMAFYNAGSNTYNLRRHDELGAAIDSPLQISGATGLLTANGGVSTTTQTVRPSSGSSSSYIDSPTASDFASLWFRDSGIARYRWYKNGSGDFGLFRYDASGGFLGTPMSISNATGAATFESITNYAADITVAALLALTPAQSAAKRLASVTGAYRMDGTLGYALAVWRGNSSAGQWVLADNTSVPVTTTKIIFLRGLAKSGVSVRGAKITGKALTRSARQDYSISTSGGAGIYLSGDGVAYTTALVGSMCARSPTQDNLPVGSSYDHYYRGKLRVSRIGTPSDNAATFVGLVRNVASYPTAPTVNELIVLVDAMNGLGLMSGQSENIHVISGNGTIGAASDTLVPIDPAALVVEIHLRGVSGADVYINENLVATITTALPNSVGNGLQWTEGTRATAYSSAGTTSFHADIYQVMLTN